MTLTFERFDTGQPVSFEAGSVRSIEGTGIERRRPHSWTPVAVVILDNGQQFTLKDCGRVVGRSINHQQALEVF